MCGRFTLRTSPAEVARQFRLPGMPELAPRYNIAPSQDVAIVRVVSDGSPDRQLVFAQWGLIPSWAKDPKIGNRMINARSETAAEKPAFRSAMKRRRCLLPADGFYEWKKSGSKKQPYYIGLEGGGLFAFAGLWERWGEGDNGLTSCTILTTAANDLLRPLHDRMPVILSPGDYDEWLDPATTDAASLEHLLAPYPADAIDLYAVSTAVNKPTLDEPQCIQPDEALEQGQLF